MDHVHPVNIVLALIIKGIVLGIIIAIAWPVKTLIDLTVRTLYYKIKELTLPTVRVEIPEEGK